MGSPCVGTRSGKGDVGEPGELVDERFLEAGVERRRRRFTAALVVPVAGGGCVWVAGDGEPRLGAVTELEVVGCTRAAHPCRHPAGVHGMHACSWPAPCERERECRYVELAVAVRLR